MSGYPTEEQVEAADAVDLQRWLRYLPSPTDAERPVMDRIIACWQVLPRDERVAASKAVGR